MSRKTISFQNPSKSASAPAVPKHATARPQAAEVDQWVHEPEDIAERAPASSSQPGAQKVPASLTISISAEPDAFEVIKVGFMLPYMTFWRWSLCAAQRNLRLLDR